jgi:hypothetical protein
METVLLILFAVLFGMGVALSVLSLSLFYKVYFSENRFSSPLIISAISFVFMWLGMTFLYIVIA